MRGKIELVSKDCESAWVVEGVRAYPPARSVRPLASKNGRGFFAFADEVGFVAYPLRAPSLKVGLAGLTPSETEMGSRVDSSRAAIVAIRFDSKVDVLPKYEV